MAAASRGVHKESIAFRYGLAAVITLAFLAGARGLYQLVSYNPLIIILTAIVVVSSTFGRGPGVMSAVIAAFGVKPLFFPSAPYRIDSGDVARFLFYLLLTGLISYLVGARRKAEAALIKANEDLDRRVQERTAELHAVNEDLRRSNEALRRANGDLEQFAFSASHDLQEPLRNVAIYGQLLSRRYGDGLDEEGRQFLKIVTGGARRMENLVNDLLTYTRAGREEGDEPEIVDANASLEEALSNLSGAIEECGATITHNGLPSLCMRRVHLQQLFQNLIGNALKYRGEEAPRIRVTADRVEDHWRFSVEDNGIGISPEYREKIFGIFKRLHHNGQYSGTGIGLAICQRLVERYDGRIWVESQLGCGARFFFTIRDGAESMSQRQNNRTSCRG